MTLKYIYIYLCIRLLETYLNVSLRSFAPPLRVSWPQTTEFLVVGVPFRQKFFEVPVLFLWPCSESRRNGSMLERLPTSARQCDTELSQSARGETVAEPSNLYKSGTLIGNK